MNKLGYACINMTLGENVSTNRSMIKKTFDSKGITYASSLALKNCIDLKKILEWNLDNDILFFRLSSNLFPWSSEYNLQDLPDIAAISEALKDAGDFVKKHKMRMTAHPGPFNKLCSSDKSILKNTIKDLETHGEVFDLIGLERSHFAKINIHVGASYGDKIGTAKVFCENFKLLSESARSRLVVENDDKVSLFSTKDLYELVYKESGIPITHDQHHHHLCDGGLGQEEAMVLAHSTWPKNITPVIHYSESRCKEHSDDRIKPQAHSDFVYNKIETYGLAVDIMIEAKFKELALKKYLKDNSSTLTI